MVCLLVRDQLRDERLAIRGLQLAPHGRIGHFELPEHRTIGRARRLRRVARSHAVCAKRSDACAASLDGTRSGSAITVHAISLMISESGRLITVWSVCSFRLANVCAEPRGSTTPYHGREAASAPAKLDLVWRLRKFRVNDSTSVLAAHAGSDGPTGPHIARHHRRWTAAETTRDVRAYRWRPHHQLIAIGHGSPRSQPCNNPELSTVNGRRESSIDRRPTACGSPSGSSSFACFLSFAVQGQFVVGHVAASNLIRRPGRGRCRAPPVA